MRLFAIILLTTIAGAVVGAAGMKADMTIAQAAASASPEVVCETWADIKPWAITRCEDEWTGEVCLIATSGFVVCRFD